MWLAFLIEVPVRQLLASVLEAPPVDGFRHFTIVFVVVREPHQQTSLLISRNPIRNRLAHSHVEIPHQLVFRGPISGSSAFQGVQSKFSACHDTLVSPAFLGVHNTIEHVIHLVQGTSILQRTTQEVREPFDFPITHLSSNPAANCSRASVSLRSSH